MDEELAAKTSTIVKILTQIKEEHNITNVFQLDNQQILLDHSTDYSLPVHMDDDFPLEDSNSDEESDNNPMPNGRYIKGIKLPMAIDGSYADDQIVDEDKELRQQQQMNQLQTSGNIVLNRATTILTGKPLTKEEIYSCCGKPDFYDEEDGEKANPVIIPSNVTTPTTPTVPLTPPDTNTTNNTNPPASTGTYYEDENTQNPPPNTNILPPIIHDIHTHDISNNNNNNGNNNNQPSLNNTNNSSRILSNPSIPIIDTTLQLDKQSNSNGNSSSNGHGNGTGTTTSNNNLHVNFNLSSSINVTFQNPMADFNERFQKITENINSFKGMHLSAYQYIR